MINTQLLNTFYESCVSSCKHCYTSRIFFKAGICQRTASLQILIIQYDQLNCIGSNPKACSNQVVFFWPYSWIYLFQVIHLFTCFFILSLFALFLTLSWSYCKTILGFQLHVVHFYQLPLLTIQLKKKRIQKHFSFDNMTSKVTPQASLPKKLVHSLK